MACPAPARPGLLTRAFDQVDGSSIAFFRIAYGCILMWDVTRYLSNDWVGKYYIRPEYNFKYQFFEWLHAWPGDWMYVHFYVTGALALMVALGLFYRIAQPLLFLAFTYIFLLEQAKYLNHFYLVSLISFLMIFVPANRSWSLDARIWPDKRSDYVPQWAVWLLQFEVGVPYFFGGIAKCNSDWAFGAEPMRDWLSSRQDFPIFGKYFEEEWMVYLFSWSGLLIDLLIVPFLLIKKTRVWAFVLIGSFHFTNARLFNIGIFPWFMLAATTIYFHPGWVRALWHDVWPSPSQRGVYLMGGAMVGAWLAGFFRESFEVLPMIIGGTFGALTVWTATGDGGAELKTIPAKAETNAHRRVVWSLLIAWGLFQTLVPLRHYLIPGNVHWREEGHRYSWHMKLRDKDGEIRFTVTNPDTGEIDRIDPEDRLKSWQVRKVATRPYMIRRYARDLAAEKRALGWTDVVVHARAMVSLNNRADQMLIDPTVDLSRVPYNYWRAEWILDLKIPLHVK